jgi:pilus assembly protein Flp/PilA
MKKLLACLRDEEGATAIEYGLIIGIMAVMIITAFAMFGGALTETFTSIEAAMGGGGGGG